MRGAFTKGVVRSITHSLGRFLAIAVIAALGTGFYAGLRMTAPDMKLAGDMYYDGTNLCDVRVMSSLGLSDADLDALRQVEGVEGVMGAYEVDALATIESVQYTVRIHSLDVDAAKASDTSDGTNAVSDDADYINRPILVEGEWPDSPGECVVSADAVNDGEVRLGDTVRLLEGTQDIEDTLNTTEYTIVGFVRSSYYASTSTLGSTSLGNGAISQYLFVPESDFSADMPYTEAFLTVEGAKDAASSSAEYDAIVAAVVQRLEDAKPQFSAARLDDIKGEAQAELDENRAEYEAEKTDAEAQLAEGKAELDDAAAQLDSAQAQLADAKAQLDSAAGTIASSEQELANGQSEYESGLAEYEAQKADAEAQLSEAQARIEAGREALAMRASLSAQLSEVQAQYDAVSQAVLAYDGASAQLNDANILIEELKDQLADDPENAEIKQELAEAEQKAAVLQATLGGILSQAGMGSYEELAAARQQAEAGVRQLQDAIGQIDASGVTEESLDAAQAEVDAGYEELAGARAQLDSAKARLDSGRSQLEQGKAEYQSGLAEYQSGVAEYEDGRAEYEEGLAEYGSQKADAEQQFADAEAKLADAQAEIDDIGEPEWYVLDRSKNVGAESFESDANRVDQIAQVFPFIFFLVAALVSLTTMTRMVEEERVLIGTYKALGYGNARITSKYLIYAVVASGVGSLVGIVALSLFLPYFIMEAYAIVYAVPPRPVPIDCGLALLSAGLGMGITVAATWFAAASTLRETPAALMLPRAPKAGKRILLERIRPLWRRMSFSWKVTARNIFRYKRRFFMAIIGIAGCTALLLTGLGLQNAINDIIDKQFGDIYRYTMTVRVDDDIAAEGERGVEAELDDAAIVEGHTRVHTANMIARSDAAPDAADQRFELVVPQDASAIADYVTMRERVGHAPLTLSDDGVLVSEKLASELGVSVGDTVRLFEEDDIGNASGEGFEVRVSGVMENYVSQYVFMSPGLYERIVGEAPVFSTFYAKAAEDLDAREGLSDELLAIEGVSTVGFNDETIDTYRTMLKSVDSVVVVLVVAAAALAFVVLYNLTNINITERAREIATLKVLGFTPHEVNAYIYRETLLLSAIGALAGLVLGIWMEGFVVVTAEVDQVMFGRDIHALSFAIAFALTMAFSVIVTLAMRRKLAKIDMVESLKSVE